MFLLNKVLQCYFHTDILLLDMDCELPPEEDFFQQLSNDLEVKQN